jgi:hypothetical protein
MFLIRTACFTFPYRLARESFMQRSFYNRNILVQPGPLTHPPADRSLTTPSFRLVDFGRGKSLQRLLAEAERAREGLYLDEAQAASDADQGQEPVCEVRRRIAEEEKKINKEWEYFQDRD